jgi:hypothetical protein
VSPEAEAELRERLLLVAELEVRGEHRGLSLCGLLAKADDQVVAEQRREEPWTDART